MDNDEAIAFADKWLDDWNRHDLDSLLENFAEDVTFTSPVAARVVPGSEGVVSGKAALRTYWSTALAQIPDLRFEIVATYVGIDTLVINYRNHRGGLVNEVLTFRDGVVVRGHGTYLTT